MRHRAAAVTAALALLVTGLTGCFEQPTPDPTGSPSESIQAPPGTRENPLPVGDLIPLAPGSAWQVGASAPTQFGDGYAVLPLRVVIDWDAIRAQLQAQGKNPADADRLGIDPWASLLVRYIAPSGRSFELFDTASAVDIPDQLWTIGTVYPPATEITANVPVSVPAEDAAGGVWTVLNTGGDAVFLAAG